jgi:hypothetical protein
MRPWLAAPLFWLFGSTFTHVTVALFFLVGRSASALGGEGGVRGAGDTGDDISVLGVEGNEVAPPMPVDPPAPPIAPPKTPPPAVAPLAPPAPLDPEGDPPRQPVNVSPMAPRAAGGAASNGGRVPGPVRLGSGRADGPTGDTIEGQRALLPGAVSCKDPVEGVWESLKYNPSAATWVRFTLLVHRAAGGVLSGSILSHTWYGNALDYTPPPCSPQGFEMSVSMVARGHVDRVTHLRFGASSYAVVATQCPTANANYAPDNFSGAIDTARQEFQSINNDGAVDIDVPYVFRRTGCLDE